MGHGHVIPNPDGSVTACGGQEKCATCRAEANWLVKAGFIAKTAKRIRHEQEQQWARRRSLTRDDLETIILEEMKEAGL